MKIKLLFLFMLFIYAALSVSAQNASHPAPIGTAPIPFGKKTQPPALASGNEINGKGFNQKKNDLPYTTFDSATKQFIRHTPDPNAAFNFSSQTNRSKNIGPATNNAKNSPSAFHLTKDINTATEGSYPLNYPANAPNSIYAVINNISYFSAYDGDHGRELWRSDGTAGGTYMVKDIFPGVDPSYPTGIIASNGLLYFSAATPDNGSEPWVSDGTEAGTHLLMDIGYGTYGSFPNQFVNVNGSVFFCASPYGYNHQVWKTDGTPAGTTMVKDLQQSGIGNKIFELMAVNDMAYFIAFTWSSGFQLFRSDGTDAGTYQVKQIGYYQYDYVAPMQLTAYDNKLYFSVNDGYGRRLWTSDGTDAGTGYAAGFNDVFMQQDYGDINSNAPFPILNNVLFISGFTYTDGSGLYKYDASNADGIVLVKDLTLSSDVDFVVPIDMRVINNSIYFKVISNTNGWHDELWITNGDEVNTLPYKIFGANEQAYIFYNANGTLYFVKNDNVFGNELWKTDGTDPGTVLVKDIFPGNFGSYPDALTFANGKLLFKAFDLNEGDELWASDGTGTGTSLVKDINLNGAGSNAGYWFKGIISTGKEVLFNAFTPALGGELYKSDGTNAGTVLLNDIATGPDWSFPNSFIFKNNASYFVGDDAVGTALYKSNGTTAGLQRITAYVDRPNYFVLNHNVTDKGLALYTLVNRFTYAAELWRSDGTQAGTYMLTPNLPYYNFSNYITTIGNTAFFIGGDYTTGYELWKTDGTIAGTMMVKDINPGYGGSDPFSFYVYKNNLYFGAYDGANPYYQRSLWKSDGTEKGTVRVINLEPTYYFSTFNTEPQHVFCESNGMLYFTAFDFNTYGNELWVTNGTEKGTSLVKNINPYYGSYPNNLTDINGVLYFTADDGINGTELWSSNGTTKKTMMVKDITTFGSSDLRNLCSAGGKLYFLKHDFTYYPFYSETISMWSSDGTSGNTNQVTDPGLTGLSEFASLTPAGNKLFFGAYSPQYGRELYEGDVNGNPFTALRLAPSDIMAEKMNIAFDVSVYPNPTRSTAALQIKGAAKNITVTVADVSGRTIWQKSFNDQSIINLPVELIKPGMYMITVVNGKERKTVQLVKE